MCDPTPPPPACPVTHCLWASSIGARLPPGGWPCRLLGQVTDPANGVGAGISASVGHKVTAATTQCCCCFKVSGEGSSPFTAHSDQPARLFHTGWLLKAGWVRLAVSHHRSPLNQSQPQNQSSWQGLAPTSSLPHHVTQGHGPHHLGLVLRSQLRPHSELCCILKEAQAQYLGQMEWMFLLQRGSCPAQRPEWTPELPRELTLAGHFPPLAPLAGPGASRSHTLRTGKGAHFASALGCVSGPVCVCVSFRPAWNPPCLTQAGDGVHAQTLLRWVNTGVREAGGFPGAERPSELKPCCQTRCPHHQPPGRGQTRGHFGFAVLGGNWARQPGRRTRGGQGAAACGCSETHL